VREAVLRGSSCVLRASATVSRRGRGKPGASFANARRRTTNDQTDNYSNRDVRILVAMSDRTFTLDEAQSLLPVLESLLRGAIDGKKLIETVDGEFQELAHSVFLRGGSLVNVVKVARRKAEREKAIQRVKDAIAEIDAIGVQVKDLDVGLLDFPCEVEGEIILLCWKLGEKGIAHWHGISEGFAGRKPIDERIAKGKRSN